MYFRYLSLYYLYIGTSEVVFSKSAKNTFKNFFQAHARNSLNDFDDVQIFFLLQLATLSMPQIQL